MSIDWTDVPIQEPKTFSSSWYSHNFSGPCLRDEVGVSIKHGNICWVNGLFPCGSHPDAKIFRLGLITHMKDGECVVAYRGYNNSKCFTSKTRLLGSFETEFYEKVLARHETLNRLLKLFSYCLIAFDIQFTSIEFVLWQLST